MMHMTKSLPPLVGENPLILVLGSLPGDKSIIQGEYYANSGNRFWPIITKLTNQSTVPQTYEEKQRLLFSHGIALWDVAYKASRKGSSDSEIRDEIPNDLSQFLNKHPSIRVIAFNGRKAQKMYVKHFAGQFPTSKTIYLRSTSPNNRQFNDDEMLLNWKQIFDCNEI